MAAVLSYQRRERSVKQNFLVRHKRTPLGVTVAYWDLPKLKRDRLRAATS